MDGKICMLHDIALCDKCKIVLVNTKTEESTELDRKMFELPYSALETDVVIEGMDVKRRQALRDALLLANYMSTSPNPTDVECDGDKIRFHLMSFINAFVVEKQYTMKLYRSHNGTSETSSYSQKDLDELSRLLSYVMYGENNANKYNKYSVDSAEEQLYRELWDYDDDLNAKYHQSGKFKKDIEYIDNQFKKAKDYGMYIDDNGKVKSFKGRDGKYQNGLDNYSYRERETKNGYLNPRYTNMGYNY